MRLVQGSGMAWNCGAAGAESQNLTISHSAPCPTRDPDDSDMPNLFRRLFDVLAGSSQGDLRRQIQYLKAENEVLRAKIDGPVRVTPGERPRLVGLAELRGSAIKALVSIVSPQTFLRWIRDVAKRRPKRKTGGSRDGRSQPPRKITELIDAAMRRAGIRYASREFVGTTRATASVHNAIQRSKWVCVSPGRRWCASSGRPAYRPVRRTTVDQKAYIFGRCKDQSATWRAKMGPSRSSLRTAS